MAIPSLEVAFDTKQMPLEKLKVCFSYICNNTNNNDIIIIIFIIVIIIVLIIITIMVLWSLVI